MVLSPLEMRRAEVRLLRSLVMTLHVNKYGVSELKVNRLGADAPLFSGLT
jgi:hypothetical protein